MLQHRMERAGQQKFICDVCGQGFYLQKQLSSHMRRHGERKFKCPQLGCQWSFYFSSELDAHVRSHTREKPYLCDICGYAASTKNRLLRHSRTHSGERKYHCDYCTYKAGTSTHLRRHMRIHIGSKPYKCPYCEYRCNTHENIRKHIIKTKKHAGMNIYPCKLCRFGTNKVAEFREHLMAVHSKDYNDNIKDGFAELTGLYTKEEDPRKPEEGKKINPIKERQHHVKKVKVPDKKKKTGHKHEFETINSQHSSDDEQRTRKQYMAHLTAGTWAEDSKPEDGMMEVHPVSVPTGELGIATFQSGATMMIQTAAGYQFYNNMMDRSRVLEYVPNGTPENVMRLARDIETNVDHVHRETHAHTTNNRPELIDYLEDC